MMYVSAVTPFAHKSESADVTVTDGQYDCRAFSYPCHAVEGEVVTEPLQLFDEAICLMFEDAEPRIEGTGDVGFRHFGVAKVLDVENDLLSVGELIFQVGELPRGLAVGDAVEFECVRIDLR